MPRIKPGTRIKLLHQTNGRCFYCGVLLDFEKYHIDHILPFSISRDGTVDNMCASCPSCNRTKSDLSIEEFRQKVFISMGRSKPIVFFFEYYGIVKFSKTIRYHNTLNKRMF